MKRLLSLFLLLATFSFLYSCKTAQGLLYKPEKLNKYESIIYIYRLYSRTNANMPAQIDINGTVINDLLMEGYVALHVAPDLYEINIKIGPYKGDINIMTQRSRKHFLSFKPESGYKMDIQKLDLSTGTKEISDKRLLTSLQHHQIYRINRYTGTKFMAELSPIHIVAEEGDIDLVKNELQAGVNINTVDSLGRSSLMIAAEKGHLAMANYLISRRADITIKSKEGNSALIMAANAKQVQMVKLLIQKGAQVWDDIFYLRLKAAQEEDLYKQAILFEKLAYLYGILQNRDMVIEYLEKYTENIRKMKRMALEDERYAQIVAGKGKGGESDITATDVLKVGLVILQLFRK